MNPWIIAGTLGVILLLIGRRHLSPPNSPLAAIRLRSDNRRDDLPVENSGRIVLLLIVGTVVLLALYGFYTLLGGVR